MYWDGDKIKQIEHYVHLEHDGRILLVDGKAGAKENLVLVGNIMIKKI